jgi:(p)ppGpp synthase/HD superfamily hydrolase
MDTKRYGDALLFALDLHANQVRKGSKTPYIAHLLSVSALVIEDGGNEDLAIAALLHDSVEDQGGLIVLDAIREKFGDHVANIVLGCSDSFTEPKPPWRERKEKYLEHLRVADHDIQLVSLADKLHNARSILRDLQTKGNQTWEKFNGKKEGTIWYYHALADIFSASDISSPMCEELNQTIKSIDSFG